MIESMENPLKWYDTILFKLAIIAIIVLALLIPSSWIQDLIVERDGYHEQTMNEVARQWSGKQLIQGPVLALPYKKQVIQTDKDNKTTSREVIETAYLLPETLKIKAGVKTDLYRQGINDVVIYNADVQVQGSFNKPALDKLGISDSQIVYDKARLIFSLSDLKGLKNNPAININGQSYGTEAVFEDDTPYGKGLQATFSLKKDGGFTFSYPLAIKGSSELNFLQTGRETDVEMTGDWSSPMFGGRYIPDSHTVSKAGFSAKWHMLSATRPFPQQWVNKDTVLTSKTAESEAVSGVQLRLAIDQYRKILRTTKYSTLIILLTFVSLFFTELIRKQRIHLFNYTLIGAAMVVYYTLLLSFAEQIGYNLAYLIASTATIALIALFTSSLLKNKMASLLFAIILMLFYGFIYIIIQLEELSLLVGSVALFIIISALMYFSRKINWDKH